MSMKALEHKLSWGRPRYDIVSRRLQSKEHEAHVRRMRGVKSTIKVKPPRTFSHLKVRSAVRGPCAQGRPPERRSTPSLTAHATRSTTRRNCSWWRTGN